MNENAVPPPAAGRIGSAFRHRASDSEPGRARRKLIPPRPSDKINLQSQEWDEMKKALLRIQKLWAGITNNSYRRALKFGVGATIEHSAALSRFNFNVVIDVGANRGQFATFARSTFPNARIISFEPLKEPADQFALLFEGDKMVRLVRSAVGATTSDMIIHVTEHNDSSSLLEVGELQNTMFGSVAIETRTIPCATLDKFIMSDDISTNSLLKIDTQGYELEVLRGSIGILNKIDIIYCEVSFEELYKSQPSASQIIEFLNEHGFDLKGVYNQASVGGRALQADMLFARR